MERLIDRIGMAVLDGWMAAALVVGVLALAMVGTQQPARRRTLARGAILAALLVLPLSLWPGRPRWEPLPGPLREAFRHHARPIWLASPWILRPLAIVFLLGILTGLGSLALGIWGCARLVASATEASFETKFLYDSLPRSRLWFTPGLRLTDQLARPVLVGVLRPTILIPTELSQPGREESIRLSLLHELAHAEQSDPFFTQIATFAQSAWWLLPPLRWICRQMRLDQEFLADRRAATQFGPGVAYASSLLGMADANGSGGSDRSGAKSSPGIVASTLFQRVLMLVRCPYPIEIAPPRWWRGAVPVLIAAGTLFASGITLGPSCRPACGPPPGDDHGQILITRLTLEAPIRTPSGRCLPYTLPYRLPARFEIDGEVWADPADLPEIEVIGHRLGPVPQTPDRVEGYHEFRLVQGDAGLSISVCGQQIPPVREENFPATFLSVRPAPGRLIRFRNLKLVW